MVLGTPTKFMPYFDKFSYTDDRCYGMTAADIGADQPQRPLATFLPKRDIERVVDYIQETFVGKGPVTDEERAAAPDTAPQTMH